MKKTFPIVIGTIAMVLIGLAAYGNSVATEKAEDAIEKLVTEAKKSETVITYDDIKASFLGNITIHGVNINNEYLGAVLKIDKVSIDGMRDSLNDIEEMEISLTNIDFSDSKNYRVDNTPDNMTEVLEYAAINGGHSFDFNASFSTNFTQRKLSIDSLSIKSDGLGTITLQAEIFKKSLFDETPNFSSPMQVGGFSLRLSDDGISERLLMTRARDGQTANEAKEELIKEGENALESATGARKELVTGILALLEGKDVTFKRDNKEPMPFDMSGMMSNSRKLILFTEQSGFISEVH